MPVLPTAEERLADLSKIVHRTITREFDDLMGLAQELWDNPELTGRETDSSVRIQDFLRDRGFSVSPSNSGLPTAFVATFGTGSLVVDMSVEFDALPINVDGRAVNHACGHNVMAAMSIAAALAIQKIADDAGITIRVQGDPGEEGLGYKIIKLEAGDYDGAHLYMGPHSAGVDRTELPSLANAPYQVRMIGGGGHDASGRSGSLPVKPAMAAFETALDNLQLYGPPGTVINHQGGPYFPGQPNVVSDIGVLPLMARNPDTEALTNTTLPRIREGAQGAGIQYRVSVVGRQTSPVYAATHTSRRLSDIFVSAAAAEGRRILPTESTLLPSSTEFWNVAHEIPGVQPLINIQDAVEVGEQWLPLHDPKMVHAANPRKNRRGVGNAIKQAGAAFAMTVARIAVDPALLMEFKAHTFHVSDARRGSRPGHLSAGPGWDKAEILHESPFASAEQRELTQRALDPTAREFQIPMQSL